MSVGAASAPPEDTESPISGEAAERRLRALEERHDLLAHELGGLCAWPALRFAAACTLQRIPLAGWSPGTRGQRRRLLSLAMGDALSLIAPGRRSLLAVTYDVYRTEARGDLSKDIIFDDLLAAAGDFRKIELADNALFDDARRRAWIPHDMTVALVRVLTAALRRVLPVPGLSRIAAEISSALREDTRLGGYTPEHVRRALAGYAANRRVWRGVLRRLRPRTLLLTTGYCEPGLCAAARDLGIPVVDFQHGMVDRWHSGYCWPSAARARRSRMPIPDRIFVYGRYWKDELLASGFWTEDEVVEVGSARMDQYRSTRAASSEPGRRPVVVTTQGVDVERVAGFLRGFAAEARRAEPDRGVPLVVKLHPCERSDAPYRAALEGYAPAQVLLSRDRPSTFELLAGARLHASISSTCHWEALGFGVPTAVLPFATHEFMLPLVRAGEAVLAREPADLVRAALAAERGELAVRAATSARYFTPGAVESSLRALGIARPEGAALTR